MAEFNFVVKNGLTVLNQLTATSTTTDTGAVIVYGGVGITEDVNIGGRVAMTGTLTAFSSVDILPLDPATSSTSGALRVAGGIGVGGNVYIASTNPSTNSTSGALIVKGGVGIGGDVNVQGNIFAVGNITAQGNIQLGDTTGTDTLFLGAEITSDILPKFPNLYTIGNTNNYWSNLVSYNANILNTATMGGIRVGPGLVDLMKSDENIWYVSEDVGDDSYDGKRDASPFKSIKHALGACDSGDTVFVAPGNYYEEFPLTIPSGVSVRGAGLREVFVRPTTATNTQTAFLLNGDTTISDFTVGGFYKPGYAFKFASSATTVLRSAYIERFTVLTQGTVITASDPYGYDSNDAGGGLYADGSQLTTSSIHPAVLMNEATFITPGATAIYLTNGIRLESLNSFSYFANKAIHAESGTTGWGGQGKTRLTLANTSGTFAVGDTLFYKGSTGTVLASGLISEVTPSYIYIQGKASGFEESSDRTPKITNVYGTTEVSTFQRKFGTGAAHFTTSSDLLEVISSTDIQFESSSYTLEAQIFLDSRNRRMTFFNKGSNPSNTIGLYMDANNKLTGQHGNLLMTGTNSLSLGTWHHVMLARDGSNNIRVFLNGALEASGNSSANVTNGDSLTIGGDGNTAAYSINGYMDEIRVSTVCRQISAFTPPTTSYDSDLGTAILLHCDGVDGASVFPDDGIGTQNVYSTAGSSTDPVIATAKNITLADYRQFGAELRSIGSAAVFGNYGAYGDGEGIDLKLIAFNMSYVGSGKDLSDDPNLAIQANEVVQLNKAKIYYQTVDHLGDFRVGNQFRINQRTGNADFGTANFKLGPVSSLTISDGINAAILQPTSIQVGSLILASNTIQTISGNLTLDPTGLLTIVESDLQVNGNLTFVGGLNIPDITPSISTNTGALTVAGGVGIGKDLHVGGDVYSAGGSPLYTPRVTIDSQPPANNPRVGDFWIDSSSGVEYQYVQDGSNFFWIQFVSV